MRTSLRTPSPLRTSLTVLALALAVAASGCTGSAGDGQPAAQAPSPSAATAAPAPSPSPTVAIQPVVGERQPAAYDISSAGMLGPGSKPTMDNDAVLAFINQVGDWLDGHLDDLQRGGPGTLEGTAVGGLIDDPATAAPITADLTSPAHPVARAHYRLAAYYTDVPRYLEAQVRVFWPDGSEHDATMLFTPAKDGSPTLVMFSAGIDAKAAA